MRGCLRGLGHRRRKQLGARLSCFYLVCYIDSHYTFMKQQKQQASALPCMRVNFVGGRANAHPASKRAEREVVRIAYGRKIQDLDRTVITSWGCHGAVFHARRVSCEAACKKLDLYDRLRSPRQGPGLRRKVTSRWPRGSPAQKCHPQPPPWHFRLAVVSCVSMRQNAAGGFEFVSKIVGGAIPKEYIPAVRKGVEDVMETGVLADFPVVDIRVVLIDGSFHSVDSSEMAFRTCARTCFKAAFLKAAPQLLEPIMQVDIATPDDYIGDLVGDLGRRRGKVRHMRRFRKGSQKIVAAAPLMELFGYATTVRSLSSGRANHAMEIKHFAPLPDALMEEVLKEARARMRGE